jgi:hypothetical protein
LSLLSGAVGRNGLTIVGMYSFLCHKKKTMFSTTPQSLAPEHPHLIYLTQHTTTTTKVLSKEKNSSKKKKKNSVESRGIHFYSFFILLCITVWCFVEFVLCELILCLVGEIPFKS